MGWGQVGGYLSTITSNVTASGKGGGGGDGYKRERGECNNSAKTTGGQAITIRIASASEAHAAALYFGSDWL